MDIELEDNCNVTHEDFKRGYDKAKQMIDFLRSQQVEKKGKQELDEGTPSLSGKLVALLSELIDGGKQVEKKEQQQLDPPSETKKRQKGRAAHDQQSIQKKAKAEGSQASKTAETKKKYMDMLVFRKHGTTGELLEWSRKLVNADESQAFQQRSFYFGEFFLQRVDNQNPSSNFPDMKEYYKETLSEFMQGFKHAPPVDVVMADFNDRPESVASLWRRWCDQAEVPHPPDDLLGKERGIAHGRLRFDMWDATFERATIHERLSAETAAAVCAKADSYLSGASPASEAFKKSCIRNRREWLPKLKDLAARFAAEAALEAAGQIAVEPNAAADAAAAAAAVAAAAAATAAAAAAAVGELPPPSPLCLSLVSLPPPFHPLCPSLSRSLSSPSLPPSLPSLPFLRALRNVSTLNSKVMIILPSFVPTPQPTPPTPQPTPQPQRPPPPPPPMQPSPPQLLPLPANGD